MAQSTSQLDNTLSEATLAKSLAPEDVCVGDYVTSLYEVCDFPSFCWCSDSVLTDQNQTVRIEFIAIDGGEPLHVVAVCLPFVLTINHKCKAQTLDVRRVKLARLDKIYAKTAWKLLKKADKKK